MTQKIPTTAPKKAICSGVFEKSLEEQGGMINKAEINKSPVVFIAKATNRAVKIIKTADCRFVETPSL